ncbi:hypothetical protein GBAR_LOCUS12682 [Geodia barretti]|uniref:Uncharacterized protein n=1 Tax=Geodia barretti TaxID=519541 RepID=A0AA35S0U4_GEOBA|nr:hypothetical protein GBAR_LOCUS12682 [Geodia barretti]
MSVFLQVLWEDCSQQETSLVISRVDSVPLSLSLSVCLHTSSERETREEDVCVQRGREDSQTPSQLPSTHAGHIHHPSLPHCRGADCRGAGSTRETGGSSVYGLIILGVPDTFMEGMTSELSQAMGDNYFMAKFFTLLITMLHVSTSATLQSHIFNFLRVFIHNFRESTLLGESDTNLRRSLTTIANFVKDDSKIKRPFGDDHEKQYIYKEPAVTTLAEIVLRLHSSPNRLT